MAGSDASRDSMNHGLRATDHDILYHPYTYVTLWITAGQFCNNTLKYVRL